MLISHFFSDMLAEVLNANGVIDDADMSQYEYCLEYLFDIIFYNFSLILFGCMLHDILGAILYIFCVSLIKSVGGGYHAASRLICSILSYSIFLTAMLTYRNLVICAFIGRTETASLMDYFYAAESFMIVLLSPVGNPNKRLSSREKVKLKSCSILLVSIVSFIYISLRLTSYKVYCIMIVECFCVNGGSQIAGLIKYRKPSI